MSIVGIANAVDLPFRKKHSAIAMRDCQLLFKPYDFEQLVDILETKKNQLLHRIPLKFKTDLLKPIFLRIIDEKAYEFIAKKVANLNGDIRVAFDLMKTALTSFSNELKIQYPENDADVKITVNYLLKIYDQKQNSKIGEIIKSFPRQNVIVLHAIVLVFDDVGAEKSVKFMTLFEETELECVVREAQKIPLREFTEILNNIESYNLIKIERNKKEPKMNIVNLNCDLVELKKELESLV